MKKAKKGPRVLLLDIETAPMLSYTWGLWDQNVGLNQVENDWFILSWAAKWLDDPPNKIMYMDQRNIKKIENDKKILEGIWDLLDEADIVVGQNSNAFDIKKLNARFILNGMQPPSSYQKIDTKVLASRYFKFTSNKLEYLSENLNTKYKKLKHEKYSGFELWKACLKGDKKAFKEMEKYNKHDVLALEELYRKLIPWDNSVNLNVYTENESVVCSCGSVNFKSNGHNYTKTGKYKRYKCLNCGSEVRDRQNLLSQQKKLALKVGTKR